MAACGANKARFPASLAATEVAVGRRSGQSDVSVSLPAISGMAVLSGCRCGPFSASSYLEVGQSFYDQMQCYSSLKMEPPGNALKKGAGFSHHRRETGTSEERLSGGGAEQFCGFYPLHPVFTESESSRTGCFCFSLALPFT